jgi:hypothetical protein
MFERILHDEYYQQYEPGIIDGPWVIVFEEFLTFEECDRLIELGV